MLLLSETVEEISDTRTTAEFSSVHFQSDQAIEKLHELIVGFLKRNPKEVDLMLAVVNRDCKLKLQVPAVVEDYIFNDIVSSNEIDIREEYLKKSIEFASDEVSNLKAKIFFLKKFSIQFSSMSR